jgi:hypothetical protein
MTENANEPYDLFVRQGIMAGNRVPVLMHGMASVLSQMDKRIDGEVGMFGTGVDGVPETKSSKREDLSKLPWMARFLRCDPELKTFCRENEYNGTCWIERDDYTPKTKQKPAPGGRASWHPGNRVSSLPC